MLSGFYVLFHLNQKAFLNCGFFPSLLFFHTYFSLFSELTTKEKGSKVKCDKFKTPKLLHANDDVPIHPLHEEVVMWGDMRLIKRQCDKFTFDNIPRLNC